MDFKNRVVVITGASSGIGRASAIQFAKKGANVVLVSRRKTKLEELENELEKFDIETLVCPCDVSDKFQVRNMAKSVLDEFHKIDVLVNNAGFAIFDSVENTSIEDIESQMNTNYFGMVYCIKEFLPKMREQNKGHIVNVASVAGSFGLPGIASYCASKFAMLGFSEGLKHELADTGVDITVVSPIMVRTRFFDHPSFKNIPKYSSTSLNAETVANAILRAANSPRLEIIVPAIVRVAVWAKHTFPYFITPILGSSFRKYLKSTK
ncbi:MAG: SDR family NAD(P)-dependent oxidoreductase [Nitrosopumilaceae archaeon]|nr:SDR family NAD(P)-dependent oxidoreductase [Nitrosopumilaceae archaeon]